MELDLERAFCKKYRELWFSLQNKRLKNKGRKSIVTDIQTLANGIEMLLGRNIKNLYFPDYTPLIGNKLQSGAVEYVYYKYVKRLLSIKKIIELMKECENDLRLYLIDTSYLSTKFISNKK